MFVRKKALKRYNDLNHMNEISKVQGQVHYLTVKKTCCNAKRWQKTYQYFLEKQTLLLIQETKVHGQGKFCLSKLEVV